MIKTIAALRKKVNLERFDLVRYKLIAEDADSMDTFEVENVELCEETRTAVLVVRKDKNS